MSEHVDGTDSGNISPGNDGVFTFDPTDGNGGYREPGRSADRPSGDGGNADDGEQPRRRGRPKGSRNNGTTPKEDKADLAGIDVATMIAGIHGMLALKLGPHWTLEGDEAKQVDKAIKRVFRHQNMKVTQKQLDYAFAAYVATVVYGTRIATSIVLLRNKPEPEQSSATLHPFPQVVPGGGFQATP